MYYTICTPTSYFTPHSNRFSRVLDVIFKSLLLAPTHNMYLCRCSNVYIHCADGRYLRVSGVDTIFVRVRSVRSGRIIFKKLKKKFKQDIYYYKVCLEYYNMFERRISVFTPQLFSCFCEILKRPRSEITNTHNRMNNMHFKFCMKIVYFNLIFTTSKYFLTSSSLLHVIGTYHFI